MGVMLDPNSPETYNGRFFMQKSEVTRVSPVEARRRMNAGQAILVCGYEPDEKFQAMHLQGAESFRHFRDRLAHIKKEQEVIFYCG